MPARINPTIPYWIGDFSVFDWKQVSIINPGNCPFFGGQCPPYILSVYRWVRVRFTHPTYFQRVQVCNLNPVFISFEITSLAHTSVFNKPEPAVETPNDSMGALLPFALPQDRLHPSYIATLPLDRNQFQWYKAFDAWTNTPKVAEKGIHNYKTCARALRHEKYFHGRNQACYPYRRNYWKLSQR